MTPPVPPYSLLQAETEGLAKAAGIGIKHCFGMAKATENRQHIGQLFRGGDIRIWEAAGVPTSGIS